jgi:hypothetical protein
MKLQQALDEIRTKPTVPLWPQVGLVLGLSRGSTYKAAREGQIDVVRFGHRIRAVTGPLRKKLGIDSVPLSHEPGVAE